MNDSLTDGLVILAALVVGCAVIGLALAAGTWLVDWPHRRRHRRLAAAVAHLDDEAAA